MVTFLEKNSVIHCQQIYIEYFFVKFTCSVLSLLSTVVKLLPIPMVTECALKGHKHKHGNQYFSLCL